jgi:hypothetical protein
MPSLRIAAAVSLVLLTAIGTTAADTESEDAVVLRAALCAPFVGEPGVLVSTTLDASRKQEAAPQEAARMGLSEEYADALKDLRTRNSESMPLPDGFACSGFKIVPRSDLASWYEHGDWGGFQRAFPGINNIRQVSLPGYNRTRDRAVVEVQLSCGRNCGSTDVFVLRKTSGKWQRRAIRQSTIM